MSVQKCVNCLRNMKHRSKHEAHINQKRSWRRKGHQKYLRYEKGRAEETPAPACKRLLQAIEKYGELNQEMA